MKNIQKTQWSVASGQWPEIKKIMFLFSLITLHLSLVTVFYGCATSKAQIKPAEIKEQVRIEKISVVGEGREVLIEASGGITYTAFELSDPDRLVLDIPGVDIEKVRGPSPINNDFITTITAVSYGKDTTSPISRIEIGLKEGISHDIKTSEGNILVSFHYKVIPSVIEERKIPETPSETAPRAGEVEKQEEAVLSPAAPGEKEEVKKADKLLRIEARKEKTDTVIKILGNGVIGNFNAFTIDKPAPPRLVVDVWNVGSSIPRKGLAIGGPLIKKVRVGEHPDKIRLVFDFSRKTLSPYTIERVEDSLVITIGKAEMKKAEVAAVPPAGAPPAASGPVSAPEPQKIEYAEIKSVDFKQLSDKARLTIAASKKVEYKLSKSQDETHLVLDMKDAVIADELRRTLDASELNTPVASISSFQASTAPRKDARILVKLKERTSFDILQEGENIQIDFPLLSGAQMVPKKGETESVQEIPTAQQLPEEGAKPGEETIKIPEPTEKYTGRKISLDFKDADISNILRLMAEISNLNIIAGDDVRGRVSLRLIDVPWDQAFDIILKTNGLGMVREGNVVRIMPLARIKQESEEILASRKAKEKLEDLEIKLLPINYAKASEMEPQVKGLMSDRGSIAIESRTNTLIIKDIPANIVRVVDLVKKLDTPTPQVLIEARIIEAQSSFARDLGVQWGAAHLTVNSQSQFTSGFGSSGVTPPSTLTPSGFIGSDGQFSAQPGFAVSLPAAGAAGSLGAMGFSFGKLIGDPFLLDLRISAGEKNGLTKTISRPRITTLDNKEAKISQGDSVPFETTSSSGTQTQFIDATLELTVTPHITPDGSVNMKIKASRNSIGSFRSAAGTPSISKKEASTEIIVKNGETAVIGGIVISDKSDTDSGIPFFKDVPILGWLFKNKSVSDTQTELLIFITPNIVQGEAESPS